MILQDEVNSTNNIWKFFLVGFNNSLHSKHIYKTFMTNIASLQFDNILTLGFIKVIETSSNHRYKVAVSMAGVGNIIIQYLEDTK